MKYVFNDREKKALYTMSRIISRFAVNRIIIAIKIAVVKLTKIWFYRT